MAFAITITEFLRVDDIYAMNLAVYNQGSNNELNWLSAW